MKSRLPIRFILICILLLLSVHPLLAQIYQGKLVDKEGKAINKASIYLKNNKSIVAYSFSNQTGNFQIDSKGKQVNLIEIRHLGYAMVQVSLASFKNGQTITMTEQANQLKEVVVKSEKIHEEGDTLNYLVNAFKGKQDRTIADVLKKMPGITVNTNGSIEYQGKAINKFYIEGMDLLGSKYSQASENLDASKVKKVQVLKHHQPIKALKNVKFSDQAALNIVLTDSAKNVWSGTADISLGNTWANHDNSFLYDNRVMLMQFARKRQSISIYKNNNTGKDIAEEITPKRYFEEKVSTDGSLLDGIFLSAPSLKKQRSLFNQSHLLATNWLTKTHSGNDLRLQVSGLWDKSRQRQHSTTIFTDANEAMIEQDISANSYHRELSGELKYEQNTNKQYLNNRLNGYIDLDQSEGMSMLNHQATREWVQPRQSYVTDKISFLRNINGNHSISANGYVSFNYLPGKLLLSDSTMQYTRQHSFFGGVETYFAHSIGQVRMQYTLNSNLKYQKLKLDNKLVGHNELAYRESRTSFAPDFSYRDEDMDVDVELPLYLTYRKFSGEQHTNFTFEPNLSLHLTPLVGVETHINYGYTWSPYGFAQLLDVPLFTDYITMNRGQGKLDNTMSHRFMADLEYQNAPKLFFTNIHYLYIKMCRQRLFARKVVDDVYESYATDKTSNSTMQSLGGKINKAWNWARLVTALTGNYSCNDYSLLIGNQTAPFRRQTYSLGIDLSLQPAEWFSIEESSSFRRTTSKSKWAELSSSSTLRYFEHSLRCFLMPGKWQVEWSHEIYHSNDKTVSFTYFSDFSVSYRTKRSEYGLFCNNIYGKDIYERRQITDSQRLYTVTRLRPREIMAKILFSF